ncbi:hypothetical protein GOZ96_22680 [Agrobacterium vitis]|uniref:Uncharacterized protein n=1 Tax=Agrobacterium vitis TaxID=373 RepID=A0A7J4X2S9_AGRVI|nr:hypothetical protein [Agrobacterium vitis]KAA3526115.1 hypothetical protein DXT89_16455 [Agrobacterium vitis]MUZ99375.1 hypothetical protein [Agrobacterium vitis]
MDDGKGENSGLFGAHTPGENPAAAKVGAVKAAVADAMGDLAARLTGQEEEAEQPSLMLDEMDEQMALFSGPVRHVANQIDIARRGRGRPKGSQNKSSREFADVLQRMGYRHPGLNLAAMANADPAALALELGLLPDVPDGWDATEWLRELVRDTRLSVDEARSLLSQAYAIIGKANIELLPYFESKAPTKLNVDKKSVMGIMVIGEMEAPKADKSDILDLTKFPDP